MDKLQREVLLAALDWANSAAPLGSDRLYEAVRDWAGWKVYDSKDRRKAIDAMKAKLTENPNA